MEFINCVFSAWDKLSQLKTERTINYLALDYKLHLFTEFDAI